MIYLRLFWEFAKIGLFSVGGGLATLPFLHDLSIKTGWFTLEELTNMLAVAESTPGPIGINMATYTGVATAGPLGGLVATLGLVFFPIIIILLLAKFLTAYSQNYLVQGALHGLRPASMGLIVTAGLTVLDVALLDRAAFAAGGGFLSLFRWKSLILAAVLAVLMHLPKVKKLHPIVFILFSALVGIVFHFGSS